MKKNLLGLLALLVSGFLLAPIQANGYENYSVTPSIIKQTNKIAVRITDFNTELNRYGVTQEKVKASVEQQLRDAGLNVVPVHEADSTTDYLDVDIQMTLVARVYTYRIAVDLLQKISPESFVAVKTWGTTQVGALEQFRFPAILGYSQDLVNEFIVARAS